MEQKLRNELNANIKLSNLYKVCIYICGSVYTNKHFAAVTDSNFTDKPVEISKYSSLYIFINNIDWFVNDMT